MTDAFTDVEPEPPGRITDDIRINNGRYMVPWPGQEGTGGRQAVSRVTTIVRAIANTYLIDRANERKIVYGMGQSLDLCERAGACTLDDRTDLEEIVGEAQRLAKAGEGASKGTTLHKVIQYVESGRTPANTVRPQTRMTIQAYQRLLEQNRFIMDPSFSERLVMHTGLDEPYCGRMDGAGRVAGIDGLILLDLKSQQSMDFGKQEIASQLAAYANAEYIWDPVARLWFPMPAIRTDIALVIWLPIGKGTAQFHVVDIQEGMNNLLLAMSVRASQRRSSNLIRPVDSLAEIPGLNYAAGLPDLPYVDEPQDMGSYEPRTADPWGPVDTSPMTAYEAAHRADSGGPGTVLDRMTPEQRAMVRASDYDVDTSNRWAMRIVRAVSKEDLSAVWRDANAAGEWTPELHDLGMRIKADLA